MKIENYSIRIKGKGRVSLPPDMIELRIRLLNTDMDYEKAVKQSGKDLEDLRQALKEEDFSKEDIRTSKFDINMKYKSIEENGRYKNKFAGYEVSNDLKINFDLDSKKLGRILNLLAASGSKPEVSIRYGLKDYDIIKEELLSNAMEDARKKAEILAKAAGVRLKSILNIDYSWSELEVYNEDINYLRSPRLMKEASYIDIEADNLEKEDSISVTWEIED